MLIESFDLIKIIFNPLINRLTLSVQCQITGDSVIWHYTDKPDKGSSDGVCDDTQILKLFVCHFTITLTGERQFGNLNEITIIVHQSEISAM